MFDIKRLTSNSVSKLMYILKLSTPEGVKTETLAIFDMADAGGPVTLPEIGYEVSFDNNPNQIYLVDRIQFFYGKDLMVNTRSNQTGKLWAKIFLKEKECPGEQ